MPRLFTDPDRWTGGSFDFLVYFGHASDEELRRTIQVLWQHPSLQGPYANQYREPSEQQMIDVMREEETPCQLIGVATLPNGIEVAAKHWVITDDDGCWLYFGVPMGSLGTAYSVGAYPFNDGSPADWTVPVSQWLLSVAVHVFEAVAFKAGVIGWLTLLDTDDVLEVSTGNMPIKRWHTYLKRINGELISFPATERGPLMTT